MKLKEKSGKNKVLSTVISVCVFAVLAALWVHGMAWLAYTLLMVFAVFLFCGMMGLDLPEIKDGVLQGSYRNNLDTPELKVLEILKERSPVTFRDELVFDTITLLLCTALMFLFTSSIPFCALILAVVGLVTYNTFMLEKYVAVLEPYDTIEDAFRGRKAKSSEDDVEGTEENQVELNITSTGSVEIKSTGTVTVESNVSNEVLPGDESIPPAPEQPAQPVVPVVPQAPKKTRTRRARK